MAAWVVGLHVHLGPLEAASNSLPSLYCSRCWNRRCIMLISDQEKQSQSEQYFHLMPNGLGLSSVSGRRARWPCLLVLYTFHKRVLTFTQGHIVPPWTVESQACKA